MTKARSRLQRVRLAGILALAALLGACQNMPALPGNIQLPQGLPTPPIAVPSIPGSPGGVGSTEFVPSAPQSTPSANQPDLGVATYDSNYGKPYLQHPTPAEQKMQEQTKRYRQVMMGGIVDTMLREAPPKLAACEFMYLRDKNARARNQCMALVIVFTGIQGVNKGYTAAVIDQTKNNRLEAARKVTADMAADNQRLQEMVDSTDAMVKESQTRLAQIRADVQAKRMTKEDADRERRANEQTLNMLSQRIVEAKQTRDEYAKSIHDLKFAPQDRKDADARLAVMSQTIATLESREKQLRTAMAPVPL